MALTFIGIRGGGKSTVAPLVARALGRPYFDADEELERRAGRTIREIFATEGESAFRALEVEVMRDLLASGDAVIAAGGGAVLSAQTRERIRRSGPAVYLRVSAETAERRICADAATAERRPALSGLSLRDELDATIAVREPFYRECATIEIDCDAGSAAELAEQVLHALPAEIRGEGST